MIMPYYGTRRRVFISFCQIDGDEADEFIDTWGIRDGVFTYRALGITDNDDFIDSTNPEYVMNQIRQRYLADSTVTIVLIGSCTHSRRYVDWEIKASLRRGEVYTPNGLIGILLPGAGDRAHLPPRFAENWSRDNPCYATYYYYPTSANQLGEWIHDAYNARTTRAHLIQNTSAMMRYNARCQICGETH
jgi:hypothetical protein